MTIETSHLTRSFGDSVAVDDINLGVSEGTVSGFLGPNGSGKTTTVRMLLGLVKPDHGTVSLFGAGQPGIAAARLVGSPGQGRRPARVLRI